MKRLDPSRSLVVFSGGQDSTTCLYWALDRFDGVEAVTFDYGQRHRIELESAAAICGLADLPQHVLPVSVLEAVGGSSLIGDDGDLVTATGDDGLPETFVPGRNLVFMTAAAALAYRLNCGALVTGVCETDYSGYPDCRRDTMESLQRTLQHGMECDISIHTPLMKLTKADTVRLARDLGALDAIALSHTCYAGQFPPCGRCDACRLREKGFSEAGIPDPLVTRASKA